MPLFIWYTSAPLSTDMPVASLVPPLTVTLA